MLELSLKKWNCLLKFFNNSKKLFMGSIKKYLNKRGVEKIVVKNLVGLEKKESALSDQLLRCVVRGISNLIGLKI
jgi:hypothetical protein